MVIVNTINQLVEMCKKVPAIVKTSQFSGQSQRKTTLIVFLKSVLESLTAYLGAPFLSRPLQSQERTDASEKDDVAYRLGQDIISADLKTAKVTIDVG